MILSHPEVQTFLAAHWLVAQCTGTSCPAPSDTARAKPIIAPEALS